MCDFLYVTFQETFTPFILDKDMFWTDVFKDFQYYCNICIFIYLAFDYCIVILHSSIPLIGQACLGFAQKTLTQMSIFIFIIILSSFQFQLSNYRSLIYLKLHNSVIWLFQKCTLLYNYVYITLCTLSIKAYRFYVVFCSLMIQH